MKRQRLPVIVLFLTALAAACREAPPTPPAGDGAQQGGNDRLLLAAAKIALPPPGVAAGDLPDPTSAGAQLVAKYCAQCHELPAPSAHSATDWPAAVRRMWLRMEWLPESLRVSVPTMGERVSMLQYLTANALQVSGASLPAGPGRETFAQICSRCHALPDPRIHSREDWAATFSRMERNMERMKVSLPTTDQSSEILIYLQSVAGRRPAR